MAESTADLAALFDRFADEIGRAAPTYGTICRGVATEAGVLSILDGVPDPQRRPVLLLAAVHHLLLDAPDEPLADHYPSISGRPGDGDPVAAFIEFCGRRRAEIVELVSSRSTQTNDVGRATLVRIALPSTDPPARAPLGLIDLGTSAGLNLHLDRFSYRYHDEGGAEVVLGDGSPSLDCLVRGGSVSEVAPSSPVDIGLRIGIDPNPIDTSDPDQARWLQACVWADQVERLARLQAALDTVAGYRHEALILRGSGPDRLEEAVAETRAARCHPVVINTWSFTYYEEPERARQLDMLDRLGAEGDLTWIFLEAPNETPELPWGAVDTSTSLSVLRRIDYRSGRRDETTIGIAHPHGRWLDAMAR